MGSSPTKPKKNVQPSNPSRTLRNLKSNKTDRPVQSNNILNDDNRILDSQSISSYHFDPHEDFAPIQNNKPYVTLNPHQIGGDPEIKFRDYLLSKKKIDMHTYYFRSNPNLKYINALVVNSNMKKITPFRNKSCKSGNCVYDIEELVKKAYEINFDYDHEFNCYQCKNSVKLGSFYFDATLNKIAEQVFKKYNKTKLQCKEIRIFRNGIWEPTLPEYLKQLEIREKDGNTIRQENKISNVDDMPILRPLKLSRKIVDFSGYTHEEEKSFDKILSQKKYPSEKTLFKLKSLQIKMKDYENLKNETISPNMMCFFLEYLDEMQKENNQIYNFDNGSLFFTFAVNVVHYDKFNKKVSYEFLKGRENDFVGNLSLMRKRYNKLAMVILIEGRWILIVVELVAFEYYVLDFLKGSLSDLSVENLADLAIYIFSKEFDADLASFNLYDVEKIHFMSDCGVYVAYFLHKLISNPHLQYIGVESKEKNIFKKQLAWALLKSSPIFSKPILFYQFKENEEDFEEDRQEKRRHHSQKHKIKKKEIANLVEDRILPRQLLKRHNANYIDGSNDQNSFNLFLPDGERNEQAKNEIISRSSMKTNRTSMKASRGSTFPDRKSKILKNPGDPNGDDEILTMTKEEFQEIMNNFKLKMLEEIKEKNAQEEEEYLKEDIQVEEDMIYMNKYHLKRLLQEYEEILRDKFEAQDEEDSENESGSSNDNGYYNQYYNQFWGQENYDDELMDLDNGKLKNLFGIKETESDSDGGKRRKKKKKRRKKK